MKDLFEMLDRAHELDEASTKDSKYYVREYLDYVGLPQECASTYAEIPNIGCVDVFRGKGYYNIRFYNIECYSKEANYYANKAREFLDKNGIYFPYTTCSAGRGNVALVLIPAYPNKFYTTFGKQEEPVQESTT